MDYLTALLKVAIEGGALIALARIIKRGLIQELEKHNRNNHN